jgi:hypothetical protein
MMIRAFHLSYMISVINPSMNNDNARASSSVFLWSFYTDMTPYFF